MTCNRRAIIGVSHRQGTGSFSLGGNLQDRGMARKLLCRLCWNKETGNRMVNIFTTKSLSREWASPIED